MQIVLTVAQVVVPIFVAVGFGMLAKRRRMMTPEHLEGLRQFVMKFGLPCLVFNSCMMADMGLESVSSMALVLAMLFVTTLLGFRWRKKRFPYTNLPVLFCAHETGMIGIPLFIILFGAEQAYRMGVLDLVQAVIAYPVLAIVAADTGENPSLAQIVKNVFSSPLMIVCMLGLALNFSGAAAWLNSVGIGAILTASTSFLTQPISALMLFSVGYNFSLAKGSRKTVLEICAIYLGIAVVSCGIMQGALSLLPNVDSLTRWTLVLYSALPASYLAPGLGRSQEDFTVASGVCSVLTVTCLTAFCVIAAFVA